MCGDFNSSVLFDEEHKNKNFSMLLHYLKKDGLVGAYHHLKREKHGKNLKIPFSIQKS